MPGSLLRVAAPAIGAVTLAFVVAGGTADPGAATGAPRQAAAAAVRDAAAPARKPTAGIALRHHAARSSARPAPTTSSAGAGVSPSAGTVRGPTNRVATRVVVPALGIDLAVMRQKTSYPACNVAMYLPQLSQPGKGGPTYLYAHARTGMFLALLEQSRRNDGAGMLGMRVEVYTGDNRRFVYRIDEVRRHVTDLRWVTRRKAESLWLQTSEGPRGTIPKLQVGASLLSSARAPHDQAHPKPRPVACG